MQNDHCYSIFSFIRMFCRSLFVLLYFFFWPLRCLFFFEIPILITPLYLQTLLNILLFMLTFQQIFNEHLIFSLIYASYKSSLLTKTKYNTSYKLYPGCAVRKTLRCNYWYLLCWLLHRNRLKSTTRVLFLKQITNIDTALFCNVIT